MAIIETVEEQAPPVAHAEVACERAWQAYAFFVALALLLPCEVVAVCLCFDPGASVGEGTWWAETVRSSTHLAAWAQRFVLPAVVCGIFLAALLGRLPAKLFLERGAIRARLPMLSVHAFALAVFVILTWQISNGICLESAFPGLYVATWAFFGILLASSWAMAILPASGWFGLAGPLTAALAIGAALNLVALAFGQGAEQLWLSFNRATFWTAHAILSSVFSNTECNPSEFILGTGGFSVHIGAPCSGYEGIGLITVFLGGYLLVFRRQLRFPHALVLLPIGIALIWLVNAARIAALITLGAYVSPAVAIEGFHSQAGWLAFNAVGLGLVAASHRWGVFSRDYDDATRSASINPAAPYLVPFVVLMAAVMICSAFSAGFDYLYPLRVIGVSAAALWYRRDYAAWRWTWSWVAIGIGAAVFVIWIALEGIFNGAADDSGFAKCIDDMPRQLAAAWLFFRILGSVVAVPFAEELAFRGFLIRRLQGSDFTSVLEGGFTWTSFVASSVLFGLLHDRWIAGIVSGMLYALCLYRRGNLVDALLAHAVTNALVATYLIFTGTWSLWV